MMRTELDKRDLLALLNWELAAYNECDGCHFTSIRRLRKRDESGCNWADAGVDADHWLRVEEQLILHRVVEETRRQYDLRAH